MRFQITVLCHLKVAPLQTLLSIQRVDLITITHCALFWALLSRPHHVTQPTPQLQRVRLCSACITSGRTGRSDCSQLHSVLPGWCRPSGLPHFLTSTGWPLSVQSPGLRFEPLAAPGPASLISHRAGSAHPGRAWPAREGDRGRGQCRERLPCVPAPRFHGNLFPGAQASQEAACQGSVWPASLLIQA